MKAMYLTTIVGLVAAATAHYADYPHKHTNGGKYGAGFPAANYQAGYGAFPYGAPGAAYGAYGLPYGAGYGANREFNYRKHEGFPVHVGQGNFYFLGSSGSCQSGHNGFYYGGDDRSFVVCDNGRSHRFQCPKGTKNREASFFKENKSYGKNDLCGVNTNTH